MIHKAFIKAEIALRYYKIVRPDADLSKEQARKNFFTDQHIDKNVLKQVTDTIHKEQRELLKTKKK